MTYDTGSTGSAGPIGSVRVRWRARYGPAMPRTVICISHATGAGGRDVARAVADRTGYRLVDEEVLSRVAEREGISPGDLMDAERRTSLLGRLLSQLGSAGTASFVEGIGAVDLAGRDAGPRSLRGLIRTSIEEIAEEGEVVIVSHAASYALGPRPDVLRVLVTAPTSTRVARVADEGLDRDAAERAIAENDAGRADYLKRFYGVTSEQPVDYDLVLNSEALDAGQIGVLIEAAAA